LEITPKPSSARMCPCSSIVCRFLAPEVPKVAPLGSSHPLVTPFAPGDSSILLDDFLGPLSPSAEKPSCCSYHALTAATNASLCNCKAHLAICDTSPLRLRHCLLLGLPHHGLPLVLGAYAGGGLRRILPGTPYFPNPPSPPRRLPRSVQAPRCSLPSHPQPRVSLWRRHRTPVHRPLVTLNEHPTSPLPLS
jgi:hypothetical protein